MGLINWIFDFYQHSKINRAEEEARSLRYEMAELRARGPESYTDERLVQAMGELALAVKTVQRLMIERGVCTESEMRQRALDIDREDGRADGRAPLF